jgi:ABC-type nitrate/sulfonate/bicarbonate transport system substrate-binding protein
MFKWPLLVFAALAIALQPAEASAQEEIATSFAIPAQTLTFTAHFVAEDAGFFQKEGLKVTTRYLTGVASVNALIAGSVDFASGTGPIFLRAVARGQKFIAIADLVDRPLVELVLRKDVAEAAGITAATPRAERAKALKGKTIAIDGVGSIIHAWERYVVAKGGLDIENDVRIAPMSPPSMLAALQSKAIDGYTTSLPYTTEAVVKGAAVMLASSTSDAPELLPFPYTLVYARSDFCKQKREVCARVVRAYAAAARMIQERPDEVYATVLKKRFPKLDPDLLAAAWKVAQKAHAKDIRFNVQMFENSQKVSLVGKLLDPKDALTSYDGVYTNEFVP